MKTQDGYILRNEFQLRVLYVLYSYLENLSSNEYFTFIASMYIAYGNYCYTSLKCKRSTFIFDKVACSQFYAF